MSNNPNTDDDCTLRDFVNKSSTSHSSKPKVSESSSPKTRRTKKRPRRNPINDPFVAKFEYDQKFNVVDPKFWSRRTYRRFRAFSSKEIHCERKLNLVSYPHIQVYVEKLLHAVGLGKTITFAESFLPSVVKEFYANLSSIVFDEGNPAYGRVFLRGLTLDFTPKLINDFLNTPNPDVEDVNYDFEVIALVLTGKNNRFDGNSIKTSSLTLCAAVLHKIARFNWTPTKQPSKVSKDMATFLYKIMDSRPINFGHHVFNLIRDFSNTDSTSTLLPFSCLISGMILGQVYSMGRNSPINIMNEPSSDCPSALYISAKLLKEGHVNDISGEKGKETEEETSNAPSEKKKGVRWYLKQKLAYNAERRAELDTDDYQIKKLLENLIESENDSDSDGGASDGDATHSDDGFSISSEDDNAEDEEVVRSNPLRERAPHSDIPRD